MSDWEKPLSHFFTYLPGGIDHWIVVYEGSFHSEIASRLGAKLNSAQFLNLEKEAGSSIHLVGSSNRENERTGFLEFVIRYPASVYGGHSPGADGLDAFISWPQSRVRLCFDVTDNNFRDLFSESPAEVTERCTVLRDQLSETETLFYRDAAGEVLTVSCVGSEWTAYTGFGNTFDYVLPSGEVACMPRSIDGSLAVEGWIVGTIPFGVKYGRIQKGELHLKFDDGKIVGVSGTNESLRGDFEDALSSAPRLRRVSEVGIGQSLAVRDAAKNHKLGYSWHERHFGLHFGLGAELPREDHGNAENVGGHHLDLVLSAGLLTGSTAREVLKW